jgi:hypothetical protein
MDNDFFAFLGGVLLGLMLLAGASAFCYQQGVKAGINIQILVEQQTRHQ